MNITRLIARPQPASGRVVMLDDSRIGTVDYISESPMYGERTERAYVIGLNGEFAVWVLPSEIAHIYGVAESAAIKAALTA